MGFERRWQRLRNAMALDPRLDRLRKATLQLKRSSASGRLADERGAAGAQCILIALGVVGLAVLPHAPDNANPFEGQGPECSVVPLTLGALLGVASLGPRAIAQRRPGKLVEGLAHKSRAEDTHVDAVALTAAALHRSNATEVLHRLGIGPALAVSAKGRQQASCSGGASAGQAFKDESVGMLLKMLGDGLIVASYGLVDVAQRADLALKVLLGRDENGWVTRQRLGLADDLAATFNDGRAYVVAAEEGN